MNESSPDITKECFAEWRSPRRGAKNPEVMTNALWAWLVDNRISAYAINEKFHGPSPFGEGPGWCFDRFGQSETHLPDGRIVYVAGEHEDYYDPDFYIYNDVVVKSPSGEIAIYCYPTEEFPPTDFHSATVVDNALILIGNLGYPDDRRADCTQVMRLDLATWEVSQIQTSGDAPGWIGHHTATLSDSGREIIVTGGRIDRLNGADDVENIDDWSLNVDTWCWTRLTRRTWPRFEVFREGMTRNHLWQIRHYQWSKKNAWHDLQEQESKLVKELGTLPDLALLSSLYAPDVATQVLGEDEDRHSVYRIRIGEIVVRYVEDHFTIQVTVEGDLPDQVVKQLQVDLVSKLSALEQTQFICRTIENQ
ncbi:MAG TPA: hypothetical protein VF472_22980 [Burkholderiaceae bacterium]